MKLVYMEKAVPDVRVCAKWTENIPGLLPQVEPHNLRNFLVAVNSGGKFPSYNASSCVTLYHSHSYPTICILKLRQDAFLGSLSGEVPHNNCIFKLE